MLLLFHFVSSLVYQYLENRKRLKSTEKIPNNQEILFDTNSDLENSIKFDPPVYKQRYAKVFETLIDERWRTKIRKLCDFGCAEFGLFIFVKKLNKLNDILFVDIDKELLKEYINKLEPLTIEYLRRREEPLKVSVFTGSVGDPDYNIQDVDVVTAIELIEHLYPDTLEAFPYNIFSYVKPKLVIVTTPNADFNVLFSSNKKRFRHYDHKFEWTREQFEDWANNIVIRFPDYTASFFGIGEGPEGTEHLGGCSQMALFVRKDVLDENYVSQTYSQTCSCDSKSLYKKQIRSCGMTCSCICSLCVPNSSWGICTHYSWSKQVPGGGEDGPNNVYKLINIIEYPFERDSRTEEDKIMDELHYRIHSRGNWNGRFFVEERDRAEIPITDLIYGPDGAFLTEGELTKLLIKNGYEIEDCVIQETGQLETCVIHKPLMDNYTNSSESSDFESNNSVNYVVNDSLSDWDDPQTELKPGDEEDPNNEDLQDAKVKSEKLEELDKNVDSSKKSLTEVNKQFRGNDCD